jgi:putative transposase
METNITNPADTRQAQWARFRFSVIGSLLSSPPKNGDLQKTLTELSQKQWKHPIAGHPVCFSVSTIERWLYQAQQSKDPINVLRSKRRSDADKSRRMSDELKGAIRLQYQEHPSWSYQLHADNLKVRIKNSSDLGSMVSYSTLRRYMKMNNFCKRRALKNPHTVGAAQAKDRLESLEVRSFEVDYVHGLWHLDFHHGSRKILGKDGQWHKPLLLSIMDDRSRFICHAQWYLDETVDSLVHGFRQALQKRGLPRALMTDNGSAMMAAEFTQGLERLSILHQPTLPYSPYQNAKQEVFWAQLEGRFMAMLEGEPEITLSLLNEALIAWIEFEYHRKLHSELGMSPVERYLKESNVGRPCPETKILTQSFCAQVKRKQRKSDGTFSLEGHRFEVPSQYRHFEFLNIRYARWDLSHVTLVDPHSMLCLDTLYPLDKSANAQGTRRTLKPLQEVPKINLEVQPTGIAPLLKDLMAQYAATGFPPAYIPKGEQ